MNVGRTLPIVQKMDSVPQLEATVLASCFPPLSRAQLAQPRLPIVLVVLDVKPPGGRTQKTCQQRFAKPNLPPAFGNGPAH